MAIGDSFTEGVGDELADGTLRGWADLVAAGLAAARGEPVEYANLAIRGRLLGPIVTEQLEPALALEPTVLMLNGGGNDMLRPRADIGRLCELTEHVITRCLAVGVRPLILSGGDPSSGLPFSNRIQRTGGRLTSEVINLTSSYGVPFADNWADAELRKAHFWGEDRLHLNAAGHHRVAARVLDTLGFGYPSSWMSLAPTEERPPGLLENAVFYRRYVMPWIRRRVTRRSSGDGRLPKYPQWITIAADPSLSQ